MNTQLQSKVPYNWAFRKEWFYAPFPIEEYRSRVKTLSERCAAQGYDLAIVHSNKGSRGDLRYLANWDNFIGGDSLLIVPTSSAEPALITNSIFHGEPMHACMFTSWIENAYAEDHPGTVTHKVSLMNLLTKVLSDYGLLKGNAALIGKTMPAILYDDIQATFPNLTLTPAHDILGHMKAIKSDAEIEMLRKVGSIAGAGLLAGYKAAKPGITEHDMAGAIYEAMMKAGAEEIPGPLAIVSGPRAGFKHVFPSNRVIQANEMVCLDIAALYGGYFADAARGFYVGDPTPEIRHMLDTALAMSDEVLSQIKAGVPIKKLMDIAKKVANKNNLGHMYYAKGFGHGIGTNKAELPKFAVGTDDILEKNMVFALEPMLVETGLGTAVVEDMVRVTENGYEILSQGCPRKLW